MKYKNDAHLSTLSRKTTGVSSQQTSPLMVSDMADGSDPMNAVLSVGNTHSCSDFPELRLYMTYVKRLPFLTMAWMPGDIKKIK